MSFEKLVLFFKKQFDSDYFYLYGAVYGVYRDSGY